MTSSRDNEKYKPCIYWLSALHNTLFNVKGFRDRCLPVTQTFKQIKVTL